MNPPKICHYCDGEGHSDAGDECGFCDKGKPLDTKEDWDRTWGKSSKPLEIGQKRE